MAGGHAWQVGGLHSRGGMCGGGAWMAGWSCAWQGSMHGRGTCMAQGVWHTANERAVHILLECILVVDVNGY